MDTYNFFIRDKAREGGGIPFCALIFKKIHELQKQVLSASFSYCVIPENIHTSSMEGIFSERPPLPHSPLWKFQLSFIHNFKFLTLQGIPIPSVCGVWKFCGTAHFV